MAKKSNTRELVRLAHKDLTLQNKKPSVRSIQAYILGVSGVSASPNLVTEELRRIEETNLESHSINEQRPDVNSSPALSVSAHVETELPSIPSNQNTEDVHARLAVIQEILNIKNKENAELRELVKKQSESLSRLNLYFAEQVKTMAKDAVSDLISFRQSMSAEMSTILELREKDKEQWDGLRKFLYAETERIRSDSEKKTEHLRKRISELETMNTTLTQAKNAAQDEVSRLRAVMGSKKPTSNFSSRGNDEGVYEE